MRRHPKTKDWFPALKIREKLLLLSILVLVLTLLFLSVVYIYWSDFIRKEYLENQKMVFQQRLLNVYLSINILLSTSPPVRRGRIK